MRTALNVKCQRVLVLALWLFCSLSSDEDGYATTANQTCIVSGQNWLLVKVLHSTRHKIGYFGHVPQANQLAN